MILTKIVSSLEKIFMTTDPADIPSAGPVFKAAKGERVSFQLLIFHDRDEVHPVHSEISIGLRSKLSASVELSRVGQVPVFMPAWKDTADEDFISLEPGLYPDVLFPLKKHEAFPLELYVPETVFVTIDVPETIDAGGYPLHFLLTETFHGETVGKYSVKTVLDVKNVTLPKSDLKFTEWFHCDSIASYHQVKMMSEKHWKLIDSYMATAHRTGINMILTPLFTPPLDTAIGGERATMQLVKIDKSGDQYSFDFKNLRRWVELGLKNGIEYFEMCQLFSQWGAKCAPKIMVTENGRETAMFGWHTPASGESYMDFLSKFLPALTDELRTIGIADNCYFHVSDEPHEDSIEQYRTVKAAIAPYLKGFKLMDALSNVEFFRQGLVECPVPATNHIEPFLKEDIDERWCYYCCGQTEKVSNRMIAMPSYRTRALGLSMYMHDISGFLQWGFNFYFSELSLHPVDPYRSTDGLSSYPAGDPFSVYPYKDGAIESLRTKVFYEGLQDRMLLKALEKKIGKDKTHAFVEALSGGKVTFEEYPRNKAFYAELHDRALKLLEA